MKDARKIYFKKGLFSTAALTLVIAAVIAANAWVSAKDYGLDVTSNQMYTLSDQTKSILKSLKKEVTVYVINNESDVSGSYKKIFEKYDKESDHITFEYKDPKLYPNFTKDYVDDPDDVAADSVVVTCNDKYRFVSSNEYVSYSYDSNYSYSADSMELEGLLTEAVNYVISDNTPVVYTLTGHSEKDLSSDVTRSFEKDNYEVKELNLISAEKVPEDCEILLINGARKDISKKEQKKMESYMEDGGRMFVFLSAETDGLTRLSAVLKKYNLGIERGVVIEGDSGHYVEQQTYLLPDIQPADATAAQYGANVYVLMPYAKGIRDLSVETSSGKEEDTEDEDAGLTVTSLLTTSAAAYSKIDTETSSIRKTDEDIDGPFCMAAAVSDQTGGRLVAVGCDNMLEASIDSYVGGANTDFVMNSVNYLMNQESKISIRGTDLTAQTAVVPAVSQKITLVMTVVVLPLLLLLFGIGISLRRRKL